MLKFDIVRIVTDAKEKIIEDRFNEHIKHSAPGETKNTQRLYQLEKELTSTFNDKQMALFLEIESAASVIESENQQHYFRLGVLDGITAGRVF